MSRGWLPSDFSNPRQRAAAEAAQRVGDQNFSRLQRQSQSAPDEPRPQLVPKGMNKTEMRYSAYLDTLLRCGLIKWRSEHEPMSIRMARRTHYRPDFLVQNNDGSFEIIDVKGKKKSGAYVREDSMLKLKIVAKLFPCFAVVITWPDGNNWQRAYIIRDNR